MSPGRIAWTMTMKRISLALLIACFTVSRLAAQAPDSGGLHEVATNWPGVRYQLFQIQRIAGNRLLLAIKVYATPQAPPGGTLIGVTRPIPKDGPTDEISAQVAAGLFRPTPFSIESAVMTDEQTKQTYSTVKPDPSGPNYVPGKILTTLHANEGAIMTIQFPVPPPPTTTEGLVTEKQTISIQLPNAHAAMTNIVIPPDVPAPTSR